MDNNKFNICISFSYKGNPHKLCFYTSNIYNKPNQKNLNENLFLIAEEKVDGFTVGYTENYLRVYVRGDFEGKKEVKIVEPYKDGAIGILV